MLAGPRRHAGRARASRVASAAPANASTGLRLRDLVLGDPAPAGRLRAALVLAAGPATAHAASWVRRRRSVTCGGALPARSPSAEHGERHAFARFVARAAAVTLDIEERGIQGSRYKVPRFVADHILASREFRPALERIADEQGRPPADLLAESKRYLKEMVSTPSALFLDLRARLDRFLFTRGYDRQTRFDPAELERLRQTHAHAPDGAALHAQELHRREPADPAALQQRPADAAHVRRHQHGLRRLRHAGAAVRRHLHPALVPG